MRVLLTGGSGFLGAHCVECLLQRGHSVVFTVRSYEKGERILRNYPETPRSKLSYVLVDDMAKEGAFDRAVTSNPPFQAVIHTASPYHFKIADKKKQLHDPAILGTIGLLKAVKTNAPTVQRVAITSSFAAMVNVKSHQKVYDETCWNDVTEHEALNTDMFTAWRSSKTFAEKAAWKFMKDESPDFEISTLNPPIMYGPVQHYLNSLEDLNTSNLRIRDMTQGKMKNGLPPTGIYIWTDVRDAASAHVRTIEVPEAGCRLFLLTAGFYSTADIADVMKKRFPELDSQLPRTYASDLDLSNKPFEIDNGPSKEVLGLQYRSLEQSVVDTVRSLLDFGQQNFA